VTQKGVKAEGSSGPQIEGAWRVTVTPTAGAPGQPPVPPFRALTTYSSGGGVVTSNSFLPTASPGFGSWTRKGHTFTDTTEAFMYQNGELVGTFRVRHTVSLYPGANTFTGVSDAFLVLPDGVTTIPLGCAITEGTRITAQSPETCR
jgi:hypothetical protein